MNPQTNCLGREKIFRCLHHLLEPAEEAAVSRHLSQCAECRRIGESFLQLDAVLGEWKGIEPSPEFDARLRQALAARRPTSLLGMFFAMPTNRALAAALAVALLVAGTLMIRHFRSQSGPNTAGQAPGQQVLTAKTGPSPAVETPGQGNLSAEEELKIYENLPVLENYDLLANFDVLSELPQESGKVDN